MNRYSKTYHLNKTLYPNLFSVIKALPEKWVLGDQHLPQLRHPGAILNRATEEIIDGFQKVLKSLSSLSSLWESKERDGVINELLQEIYILFGHFDSFQDECYLILKTISPVPVMEMAQGEKSVKEWLRRNGYECSLDFLNRTSNIQQLVDCFTNRLKHANQILEFVCAEAERVKIYGFFIEELKGEIISKVYQPLPEKQLKVTVAISFNSILKTLLICFYELCDALEKVVKKHIKILYKEDFTKRVIVKHSENFFSALDLITNMEEYFYPYEYKKFARIVKNDKEYTISYPHNCRVPYSESLNVMSVHHCDGYTKTFPLVSFG